MHNVKLAIAVAVMALSACSEPESPTREEAIAERDDLQAKLNDLKEKIDSTDTDVSELRDQMDRMDTEDWKDVVSDLRSAVDQVESDHADEVQAVER